MIHDSKVNTCDRSNELKLAFFWNIFVTKKILTRWHDSFKNDQSSLFVFFVFLLHHVTNLFRSSQKYIFIDIFYLSATWIKHNHQGGLFTWIWTWTLGLTLSKTIGKNPKLTLCAEREREREKAMRTFSVQHLLQNDQSLKANNHVVKAKTSLTDKNLLEINTRQTVAYSILVDTQHHTQGVKRDLIIGVYQQDVCLCSLISLGSDLSNKPSVLLVNLLLMSISWGPVKRVYVESERWTMLHFSIVT